MYAIKANKQYKIEADEKQKYINLGYNIAELVDGELKFEQIETKETKEIAKLKEEIKKLKEEIKSLKGEGK